MPYPNKKERREARERMRYLRLECRRGKHNWQPSASPDYQHCVYCNHIRRTPKDERIKDDNASVSN